MEQGWHEMIKNGHAYAKKTSKDLKKTSLSQCEIENGPERI